MAFHLLRFNVKVPVGKNVMGLVVFRNGLSQTRFQATKAMALELEHQEVAFDDSQRFFDSKQIQEIIRAMLVLKLSSSDAMVKNSLPLMNLGQRVLGNKLFEFMMKQTMYGQFVAGETHDDVKATTAYLRQHGISSMLCVPTEEDLSESKTDLESSEPLFDRNAAFIHDCITKTERGSNSQMRITAICSPIVLKRLTELLAPYETSAIKPDELGVKAFARGLNRATPSTSLIKDLTDEENIHLKNSLQRLDNLAKHSIRRNIRLIIDAEQSYLEGGIRHLILTAQSKYNKWYPWVYATYQCYRKDTLDRVMSDLHLMSNEGFYFGAKLVRGAYRELEGVRSRDMGYVYPIHDSYEDTCHMYNDVLQLVMDKVADSPAQVMVATHNEDSIRLATRRMGNLGIHKNGGGVSFAQLYGMCDQASLLLGRHGYEVYKSLPCGSVETTLPYLARRAQENRDVMSRTARERSLYWKEIGYRLKSLWQPSTV